MSSKSRPEKRGPKPDHLKIEGDWADAVKKAIQKPPPKRSVKKSPKARKKRKRP